MNDRLKRLTETAAVAVSSTEIFIAYIGEEARCGDPPWYAVASSLNSAVSLLDGHDFYGTGYTPEEAIESMIANCRKERQKRQERAERDPAGYVIPAGQIAAASITCNKINVD